MEISELKEYIYDNRKVEEILTELNCHSIKYHNGTKQYWSCAFPDGDNTKGLIVYDNEYLGVTSYTRQIENPYGGNISIIDVVCFIEGLYLYKAIKWLCDLFGLDYYSNPSENLPESLQWTKMIIDMQSSKEDEKEEYLKPINEYILNYYKPYVNNVFKSDGISYEVQRDFEVGYDLYSNRYTMPIRDELGTLVGVKGRYFDKEVPDDEEKYIYLEPCAKTKVLYGLYKSLPFIKKQNKVIVIEAEKGVLKAWTDGIYYIVAIGGHDLSKTQVHKLTSLGVEEIILCYDQDVFRQEDGKLDMKGYEKEVNKFIPQQRVSVMIDKDNSILNIKESPIDDLEKFKKMYDKRVILR